MKLIYSAEYGVIINADQSHVFTRDWVDSGAYDIRVYSQMLQKGKGITQNLTMREADAVLKCLLDFLDNRDSEGDAGTRAETVFYVDYEVERIIAVLAAKERSQDVKGMA